MKWKMIALLAAISLASAGYAAADKARKDADAAEASAADAAAPVADPAWAHVDDQVGKCQSNRSTTRMKPPKVPKPDNCDYTDNIRFAMAVTSGQNWQTWYSNSATLAKVVVDQWLVRFGSLTSADYPGVDWTRAGDALGELQTELNTNYNQTTFRDVVLNLDTYGYKKLYRSFSELKRAGMALEFICFDNPSALSGMFSVFESTTFLASFDANGLGDMSLDELFNSEAKKEKDASGNTNADGVSRVQVNLVALAQSVGFLTAPSTKCTDLPFSTSDAGTLTVNNKCCHRTNRVCQALSGGTCNMCSGGTVCCLAGVTWCPGT